MRGLSVLALLALAGCNTSGTYSGATTVDTAGPPPTDYRIKIANYVKKNFKDPYTIRDAEIGAPMVKAGWFLPDAGPAWSVCIKANAKNSYGAYVGQKETIIRFKSGEVDSSDEGTKYGTHGLCADVKYEPFPEIEEGNLR